MKLNSLAFRLFASAAVWALLVLPIAAFVLISLHRNAIEQNFDAVLSEYLKSLVAGSAVAATDKPNAPASFVVPRFSQPFSGWYWQISPLGGGSKPLFTSSSLLDETLSLPSESGVPADENNARQSYITGPEGQRLRILEREVSLGGDGGRQRFSYAVAGVSTKFEKDIAAFQIPLFASLAALGLGLVVTAVFMVRFGLRPLRAIRRGLAEIRSGEADRLEGEFPAEIVPLQEELNALITSNHDIIERARMHVGNLAHALKTPMSVITNEAHGQGSGLARKVEEQVDVMRTQIAYHLDRARVAAGVGVIGGMTEVEPVLEALVRVLSRLHEARGIGIDIDCAEGARFRGEKQDLEEMVGNLLDNACKWAASKVVVSAAIEPKPARGGGQQIVIHIDDDGPGLTEAQRETVFKRGRRLDETKPGSGLGLSIVADLAHLYQGVFELDTAPTGGLRARLMLPAA